MRVTKNYLQATFLIASLCFSAFTLSANAEVVSNCTFKYYEEPKYGGDHPDIIHFFMKDNEAFYLRTGKEPFRTVFEVYSLNDCRKIATGKRKYNEYLTSLKSSGVSMITESSIKPLSVNFVDNTYSSFLNINPYKEDDKILVTFEKTDGHQRQLLDKLHNYIHNANSPISSTDLRAIDSDPLLQSIMKSKRVKTAGDSNHNHFNEPNIYLLAYIVASENFELFDGNLYFNKSKWFKAIEDYPAFGAKYAHFILNKGSYKHQNTNTLSGLQASLQQAETNEQYRTSELMLINKIKDKLISFTSEVTDIDTERKSWHEYRLIGIDTTEGAVYAFSNIRHTAALDTQLYQPKQTYKITAKLETSVDYSNGTSKRYETPVTLYLGGDKVVDSNVTTTQWLASRAGAGSFALQDYTYNNVDFKIKDINVE